MSDEQSIRDEIADEIAGVVTGEGYYSMTIGIGAAREAADLLLASPVIRRIQAEALRSARADIQAYTDAGSPFGHRPVEQFLDARADRIERGETA